MALRQNEIVAIKLLFAAIVDAVKAAGPRGAPGGPLYAALMGKGVTLEQFNMIMGALVTAGQLTKSGDLYFVKGA